MSNAVEKLSLVHLKSDNLAGELVNLFGEPIQFQPAFDSPSTLRGRPIRPSWLVGWEPAENGLPYLAKYGAGNPSILSESIHRDQFLLLPGTALQY
jgi:hypothetical protein